jgi:hypothetical protein
MRLRTSSVSVIAGVVLLLLPSLSPAQVALPPEKSPLDALKRLFCANFDGNDFFAQNVGGGAVVTPVSTNLVNTFLFQSQTFPNASSSAGFTFTWAGGAPIASELYGPLFGERGLTNGKGKLSATVSYQELSWATYDEQEIRLGTTGLNWGDLEPEGLVPSDPYLGICNINLRSRVLVAALNYGLHPRLDVSAAVPYVWTSVSGTSEFTPAGSTTVGNLPPRTFATSSDASGVGDLSMALKWGMVDSGTFALALRGGATLGTGSADKMTGTGQNSFSGFAIAGWESGQVSLHGQVGYIGVTGDPDEATVLGVDVYDEFDYVLGLDYAPIPERLTVGGEFIARRLLDAPTFDSQSLTAEVRSFNVYFFSIGAKVRLVQRLLGTAFFLIPAGDSGMLPRRPSFNAGLNYVF